MPDSGVVPSRAVEPRPEPSQQEAAEAKVWRMRERATIPGFTLARHLAQTLGVAALIAGLGVWLAIDASPWAWLLVPVFWLVANVFEWATHRYPMHRPLRPRLLYDKHAIAHHNAFAGRLQEIRNARELSLVMMPWYTLLIIFMGASPIAVVVGLVAGQAVAGVFLVSAVIYFLVYEAIHTVHHLPTEQLQRSVLGRGAWLARLRAHHHRHHELERMTKVNFNVTFPLADRLFGTYDRG